MVCSKCKLDETKKCGNVLVVKEKKDGKEVEVKYYLKDKGAKEAYHKEICTDPKKATVTGVVKEEKVKNKDDETKDEKRKVVTEAKVEFTK